MKNLVVFLFLFLINCGGGGGSQAPAPTPNTALRSDLYYAYYGSYSSRMFNGLQGDQLSEVKDHTNIFMSARWGGPKEQELQLQEAASLNIKTILDLPESYEINGKLVSRNLATAEIRVRDRFQRLKDLDLLKNVIAVYPQDEPDLHGIDADWVNQTNQMIRKVGLEFNFQPKLAVIYTAGMTFPGIASYDWVGFDNYDEGEKIFTNGQYNQLKAKLRADQQIILVPGGADKWRQQPDPFFNMAQSDLQVKMIMPFIWLDQADPANGTGRGIRSNGLDFVYRQVGLKIKNGG